MRTDLKGQRFGRLLVLSRGKVLHPDATHYRMYWKCRCDCGTEKEIVQDSLLNRVKSCGCLKREQTVLRMTTHGKTRSETWKIWVGMRKRCYSTKSSGYLKYGSRGIQMCARWRNSFENFLTDMGERPTAMTIERIDNEKDYSPDNCRWATLLDQASNRRDTVRVFDGESLAQCARRLGLKYKSLHNWHRIHGLPIEEAILKATRVSS